jgi:4-amino-4-deoxy-L-arabinose transferase-like glycosyltransferase
MDVTHAAEPASPARAGIWAPLRDRLTHAVSLPGSLVVLLTATGAALRIVVSHQSLFADELSTYWIVTTHGLGGVLSTVHSNAEITPPLYFVASWLTSQISHAPEMVRAPSLVAGAATIPLVYLLGMRTLNRFAALVAAALVAFAPFMVYYSTEARGYAVMMALTLLSTLAMLLALDSGRRRWWIVYGLASAGAAYSHYTSVFVLAAQLLWLLWAHPKAWKPAIYANLGAVALFLPWLTGLRNDLTSPTTKILSALSPFNADSVRVALEHWTIGYPYASIPLRELPGKPALALLAVAVLLGIAGVVRHGVEWDPGRRLVLLVVLFLAVPVGEAVVSAVSTNLFGVRNLAPSWPEFALLLGALFAKAGRFRYVAAGLAVTCLAVGTAKMLTDPYERPQYVAATRSIDALARPGDVIVDGTAVLSPGPLSGLDVVGKRLPGLIRAQAPREKDHPFGLADPVVPLPDAIRNAVAAARGRRIFVVTMRFRDPRTAVLERLHLGTREGPVLPRPYELVEDHDYRGIVDVVVNVYAARPS